MDNNKKDFKPYIPADKVVPEFTVTALLIGILLAIVFGARRISRTPRRYDCVRLYPGALFLWV